MTLPAQHPRAWSFLALGASRQFAGNAGYDDLLISYYSFDSTVPNHALVRVGDLAVLRDSDRAIGMGWIERMVLVASQKHRRRCPECHTTAMKTRLEKQPRYRCDNGHQFARPFTERIAVTAYRAYYAQTWLSLGTALSAHDLINLCLSRAQQHAIRELRLDRLKAKLIASGVDAPEKWWTGPAREESAAT